MDISKVKVKVGQIFIDRNGAGEITITKLEKNTCDVDFKNTRMGFISSVQVKLLNGCPDNWNGGGFDWKLRIAIYPPQTWYVKDSANDMEFILTSIDWASGCCYGELRDNRTGSITPSHRIIHTKGLLSQYWELKNDEEEPITARSIETHTHTQEPDGYKCDRCGDYNTMVAINTPEGTYRCRGCRSSDSMKYSKYHSNRK
jgi:hypothetical protein